MSWEVQCGDIVSQLIVVLVVCEYVCEDRGTMAYNHSHL